MKRAIENESRKRLKLRDLDRTERKGRESLSQLHGGLYGSEYQTNNLSTAQKVSQLLPDKHSK